MTTARVLQGDVFDLLPTVEPGSIDCAITSPPYWKLRSYLPKGHPLKPRELGGERTPAEYVENMVRVFRLVRECLAPHGTLWVNVGDTYSSDGVVDPGNANKGNNRHGRDTRPGNLLKNGGVSNRAVAVAPGIDAGNLCLIPQRLAIALQDDGWTVRSVIVWHKPAPMPSSVQGWSWRRCRVKIGNKPNVGCKDGNGKWAPKQQRLHESTDSTYDHHKIAEWSDCPGCRRCTPHGGYVLRRGSWRPTSSWEPVLMLAKGPAYYADGEAVKTPPAAATVARDQYTRILDDPDEQFAVRHDHETLCDGANLRDVWTIAAEPLREKHYAAFPTELVERCLLAGTSAKGYCPSCGAPWCRVVEKGLSDYAALGKTGRDAIPDEEKAPKGGGNTRTSNGTVPSFTGAKTQTVGWRPSCPCPPHEPRPGRVLDPFSGSGRTGLVCQRLGLDFTGCELNPEYADMSRRILQESMPLFAAGGGGGA